MMVVDVGNTDTVIGLYINDRLISKTRFTTKDINFKKKLSQFFLKKNISKFKYNLCIISSVVPSVDNVIFKCIKKYKFKIVNLTLKKINDSIIFKYEPNQLGADRIANTYAAIKKYGKNSIIIDFGTATTFDVVKNNIYHGGSIAPGINVSHKSLVSYASKLKKISIKKVNIIVGKNTKESMQSGFYWGYVGLINKIIKKILIEKKFKPKIILTGGLANVFKEEIKFKTYYEPNLTLEGLYHIGLKYYA